MIPRCAVPLVVIALVLGAYGLVDRIERDQEHRLSYRAWVADACTPAPGETVIAKHDGKKLHCTIYSTVERGLVPIVVSAAVMEVPL